MGVGFGSNRNRPSIDVRRLGPIIEKAFTSKIIAKQFVLDSYAARTFLIAPFTR